MHHLPKEIPVPLGEGSNASEGMDVDNIHASRVGDCNANVSRKEDDNISQCRNGTGILSCDGDGNASGVGDGNTSGDGKASLGGDPEASTNPQAAQLTLHQ